MHIFIIGGSGMIGTALARQLIADQNQVTILSRNPSAHAAPPGVSLVQWDGRTSAGWSQRMNDVDAVVNLNGASIGAGLWTKRRKLVLTDSRLNAGAAITEAIQQAEHKPEVLIQASEIGYYRPSAETVLDETSPQSGDFQGNLCQVWEESTLPVEQLGVRRVVIRSGVVLARGALIMRMFLLPFRFFAGGPVGSGRQYLSWIHIEDEISGILFLLKNKQASGVFNLMSPQPVRNDEMGKIIGRILRRPYWFPVPAFALRLVLGEMSSIVLDSWRGVPARLNALDFQFKFPDIESAVRD
jgi:uncharacterized protein (TIGR01777 family)